MDIISMFLLSLFHVEVWLQFSAKPAIPNKVGKTLLNYGLNLEFKTFSVTHLPPPQMQAIYSALCLPDL